MLVKFLTLLWDVQSDE